MKRRLIPLNRPLVVLDTGPARNNAHDADNASPEPSWVGTFEHMREDGYAFCLADGAFAELLTQVCEGRISEAGHRQMVATLERFLDVDFYLRTRLRARCAKTRNAKGWQLEPRATAPSSVDIERLADAKQHPLRLNCFGHQPRHCRGVAQERANVDRLQRVDGATGSCDGRSGHPSKAALGAG